MDPIATAFEAAKTAERPVLVITPGPHPGHSDVCVVELPATVGKIRQALTEHLAAEQFEALIAGVGVIAIAGARDHEWQTPNPNALAGHFLLGEHDPFRSRQHIDGPVILATISGPELDPFPVDQVSPLSAEQLDWALRVAQRYQRSTTTS